MDGESRKRFRELSGKAVAILVEAEKRRVADGFEVTVIGRLLLPSVHRTLGAVDIVNRAPGGRSGGFAIIVSLDVNGGGRVRFLSISSLAYPPTAVKASAQALNRAGRSRRASASASSSAARLASWQ